MGKKGVCISRENLLAALHHLVGWLVGCTEQARVEKVGDAKKVPELSSSQHRKESGSFKRIHPFEWFLGPEKFTFSNNRCVSICTGNLFGGSTYDIKWNVSQVLKVFWLKAHLHVCQLSFCWSAQFQGKWQCIASYRRVWVNSGYTIRTWQLFLRLQLLPFGSCYTRFDLSDWKPQMFW